MSDTHVADLGDGLDDEELDDADLVGAPAEDALGDEEDLTTEQAARIRGWKPLPVDPANPQPHEYGGNPANWRPAAEFLSYGDADLRTLRNEVQKLTGTTARLERELAAAAGVSLEQKQALTDALNLARRAETRGYERAKAELEADRRNAVETGDTETFDKIQAQIDALDEDRAAAIPAAPPAAAPAAAPAPAAAAIDPAIAAFRSANAWFISDPQARQIMIGHFQIVEAANPALPTAEQLQEAKRRTAAELPGRIPDMPAAPRPPADRRAASLAAPRGGPAPRRPAAPDGWAQIEDAAERGEARREFERMSRHDPTLTEESYLAIYLNPKADVLAVQRAQRQRT